MNSFRGSPFRPQISARIENACALDTSWALTYDLDQESQGIAKSLHWQSHWQTYKQTNGWALPNIIHTQTMSELLYRSLLFLQVDFCWETARRWQDSKRVQHPTGIYITHCPETVPWLQTTSILPTACVSQSKYNWISAVNKIHR